MLKIYSTESCNLLLKRRNGVLLFNGIYRMVNIKLFNKFRFQEQSEWSSCESINKMIVSKQRKCLEEFVLNSNKCSSAVTKTSIMITYRHPRGLWMAATKTRPRLSNCFRHCHSLVIHRRYFWCFLLVANAISLIHYYVYQYSRYMSNE